MKSQIIPPQLLVLSKRWSCQYAKL
eukprot:COSAG01_NODE_39746_length_472_cov_2.345845_1_plen_24_part_01